MRFRRDDQLDEEIEAHFRLAVADRVARGEAPDAARRAARAEFGGEALVKEVTRQMWGWAWLAQLAADLRYAARVLRKSPAYTTVVVLTLALGVGANTAIYSMIHAALTPLAIPDPDRVVMVWSDSAPRGWHGLPASAGDFWDWRGSGAFSALAALNEGGANLRWQQRSERVNTVGVTGDFWNALSTAPRRGRAFTAGEFSQGHDHVAILTYPLWNGSFAADPTIVGKEIVLDGAPYTVVGVLGKEFPRVGDEQVYIPLAMGQSQLADRRTRSLVVVGRLRPGLTLQAAGRRLSEVAARLGRDHPEDVDIAVRLQPIEEANNEDSQTLLSVLFAAVGFVLLIACANIAGLALARATVRGREMTVRAALGAGKWRLARQLLTENLLLAMLGSLVSVVPAWLGIEFVKSFHIEMLPQAGLIGLNWSVLGFNFATALVTGLLFGLAPAWQMRRVNVSDALKASSRGNTGGHQRLRGLLVAGEVALTLVLLVGAALMIGSFWRLRRSNPGFDPRQVVTMKIALDDQQYSSPARQIAFFDAVLERARSLPGVISAGAADELPLSDNIHGSGFHAADRPEPRPEDITIAIYDSVTPGYFEAMRIALRQGRLLDDRDRQGSRPVAVVDERIAAQFWPGQSALGKMFHLSSGPEREIVGVVGQVDPPAVLKLRAGRMGQVYLPFAQESKPALSLAIRTPGNPASVVSAMRETVRRLDANLPLFEVRTMDEVVAAGRVPEKLAACLLGAFAVMALLLAAVGIYGVVAYSVGRRWREFGIRMSLGAQPADVLAMVLRQGALMAGVGIAVGLGGAFLLTRAMGSLLHNIAATDPLAFAGVTVLLAVVALAAAYLPARRATRVDPMMALREE